MTTKHVNHKRKKETKNILQKVPWPLQQDASSWGDPQLGGLLRPASRSMGSADTTYSLMKAPSEPWRIWTNALGSLYLNLCSVHDVATAKQHLLPAASMKDHGKLSKTFLFLPVLAQFFPGSLSPTQHPCAHCKHAKLAPSMGTSGIFWWI